MKTRLIALNWKGSASVDPRFSAVMLQWILADICTRNTSIKLSVGIENGNLEAYNSDFELQFNHQIKYIVGMARVIARRSYNGRHKCSNFGIVPKSSQISSSASASALSSTLSSSTSSAGAGAKLNSTTTKLDDSSFMKIIGIEHGMIYLVKNPKDPLLHIYLYESDSIEEMTELMHQMRDPSHTLGGSVGSIPSSFVATSASNSSSSSSLSNVSRKHELILQKALHGGIHSTPASNLKLTEAARLAQHDGSPSLTTSSSKYSTNKMSSSKSYTSGLSHSVGTVNISSCTSVGGSTPSNIGLSDISPNNSQLFEVLYVGKIKVSHKRVPYTFIDDAIPKFQAYDAQKIKEQMNFERKLPNTIEQNETENLTTSSTNNNNNNETITQQQMAGITFADAETSDNSNNNNNNNSINRNNDDKELKIVETTIDDINNNNNNNNNNNEQFKDKILNTKLCDENKENNLPSTSAVTATAALRDKTLMRGISNITLPSKSDPQKSSNSTSDSMNNNNNNTSVSILSNNNNNNNEATTEIIPKLRDRSASIGSIPIIEQNRTMVFLIGQNDLRIISPDRKKILLKKEFKDIASCAQGNKNNDHFGIICREANTDGYMGFVFKCQSGSVADDIVTAISQAFSTCSEQYKQQQMKERNQIFSCEHCPMLWYHKLCTDIDGLSDKKTHSLIFRRIESLTFDEQNVLIAKYDGAEEIADHAIGEKNQFLMMLLRAHCESKQQRHVHDTAENRSEFLNQYLGGGGTIFTKAKRSLTNSFDHLLNRKNIKDDVSIRENVIPTVIIENNTSNNNNNNNNKNRKNDWDKREIQRPRAASIGSAIINRQQAEPLKSPKMEIFMKVGNSPKENKNVSSAGGGGGSWRQEILNRVVTPSKNLCDMNAMDNYMSPLRRNTERTKKHLNFDSITNYKKRSTNELRELWKTAIRQIILLSRMEKENAKLQARQNDNELKKLKLDYDEIVNCDKHAGVERWEHLIDTATRITNKLERKSLLQAIKNGVPRTKRGEIWIFLSQQYSMNVAPIDTKKYPNYNTPYNVLLKNLTEHQHAIFIDLGRTFPNHKFYKPSLGVGQLSLFNILKAYSILDPELGYCQGLGFICAVLLLHCEEEEAFNLLKHLMFCRQMRTNYLPDMKDFQLQLYQLSRLVKDLIPDLYSWLDENEVSPTLYAAPWILTVFSSQFPLGFVTRTFDLLFLESSEVIFRVAVALLDVHKDELLKCENCEEIMGYLKNTVTQIDADIFDKILKKIFSMDIKKQMSEYQVEYNVLQEEISTSNHHLDSLNREKEQNNHLVTQLQFAQSSIAQLEKTRTTQQNDIHKLQAQVQSLEITIETLGEFITQLIDHNHDINVPGSVRRIIENIGVIEQHRKKPIFIERKIGKSVSVNAQLGLPLKVLEECNECEKELNNESAAIGSSDTKLKTPFFENTYQKLREQNKRPNRLIDPKKLTLSTIDSNLKLPEHVEKALDRMVKNPYDIKNNNYNNNNNNNDSGIATPISPPSINNQISQIKIIEEDLSMNNSNDIQNHPLSNCGDVNVRYNGTTQLKTIRSGSYNRLSTTTTTTTTTTTITSTNDTTTISTNTLRTSDKHLSTSSSNPNIDMIEQS